MTDAAPHIDWPRTHVHFIAIGGIGMSALARIARAQGATVSGCDCAESTILDELRSLGCTCSVGHSAAHLRGVDLVVHSSAVPADNPERHAALTLNIPDISRGRLLAWLQQDHDTVAISGAHGKTTTTWIAANLLIRAGADPTVAVGGVVSDLGGNARVGKSALFVTEADESDGSFLYLNPKYPVITNVDADHLDYYGNMDAIKDAFVRFTQAAPGGAVIACADCPNVQAILPLARSRVVTFGVGHGDIAAHNVRLEPGRAVYDAALPGGPIRNLVLSLPGIHNVRNSLAALALAHELDLPLDAVRDAFANTSSVGRRLERRGCVRGVTLYDDYAHHPAEIAATLESARMLAPRRLVGIFQPHRYTRTQLLHREFGSVFGRLDLLLIAPIYAASERPIDGVTSELIAREVQARGVPVELLPDLAAVPDRLAGELAPGDTLITIGAGDVWKAGDAALARIRADEDALGGAGILACPAADKSTRSTALAGVQGQADAA